MEEIEPIYPACSICENHWQKKLLIKKVDLLICPRCLKDPHLLTDQEILLLETLGDCWNEFAELKELHSADKGDFAHHIHALQNIIMSRAAVREYPNIFFTILPREEEGE